MGCDHSNEEQLLCHLTKWLYFDCIHNPVVKVTVCIINLSLNFKQILSIDKIMSLCLIRDLYTSSISI